MRSDKRLSQLKVGDRAQVIGITAGADLRRRLSDMGLIEGSTAQCVLKSPLGDPKAYIICDTVVAIRSCDADTIFVRDL